MATWMELLWRLRLSRCGGGMRVCIRSRVGPMWGHVERGFGGVWGAIKCFLARVGSRWVRTMAVFIIHPDGRSFLHDSQHNADTFSEYGGGGVVQVPLVPHEGLKL